MCTGRQNVTVKLTQVDYSFVDTAQRSYNVCL